MKRLFVIQAVTYITTLILWLIFVVVPYAKEGLVHIQKVINEGVDLSLLLLAKDLGIIVVTAMVGNILIAIVMAKAVKKEMDRF